MTHPRDPYATPQPYWDRQADREIDLPCNPVPAADPHSHRIGHVIGLEPAAITEAQVRAALTTGAGRAPPRRWREPGRTR